MSINTRSKTTENREDEEEENQQRTINDAVNLLANLDSTTSLRGNVQVQLAVDCLFMASGLCGLNPEQLSDLVKVITNDNVKISQTIQSKLVKCLVPSHTVPQDAVIRVIYKIVSGLMKGSSNLDSLMLRWILVVFDHLDGYDRLHRLYALIFPFVDCSRLLANACQLLFLLTRKQDVVFYRAQRLLDLLRQWGPEPCIMGLLMIYKVYSPHLVTIRLKYGSKAFFKNTDSSWRSVIESVVRLTSQGETKETHENVELARKRRRWIRTYQTSKREKLSVPEVHSAMDEIQEEEDLPDELHHQQRRIPYGQIDSFTCFLQNVSNIEYPSQVSAMLKDTQLQLLVMCDPDPVVTARLSLWIQQLFVFGFSNTDVESKQNEELLKMLLCFSQHVQDLPVLGPFLHNYLRTWDGQRYAPVIFCLISQLKPNSFEVWSDMMKFLLKLFYSSDVYFKVGLTKCITNLLQNWGMYFLQASLSQQDHEIRSTTPGSGSRSGQDEDEINLMLIRSIMFYIIKAMDTALVLGLRVEDEHVLLQSAAVDFMEMTSVLYLKYNLLTIYFPTNIFYRLLLSKCPDILAVLCGCINSFRSAIINFRGKTHDAGSRIDTICDTVMSLPSYTREVTSASDENRTPQHGVDGSSNEDMENNQLEKSKVMFNTVLQDIMDTLWRGRMFIPRNRLPSLMSVDRPLRQQIDGDPKGFTLILNHAFLGLAYKFLREANGPENIGQPLHIQKHDYLYLDFLEREGFPQFKQFVNTNSKRDKNHRNTMSVLHEGEENSKVDITSYNR